MPRPIRPPVDWCGAGLTSTFATPSTLPCFTLSGLESGPPVSCQYIGRATGNCHDIWATMRQSNALQTGATCQCRSSTGYEE